MDTTIRNLDEFAYRAIKGRAAVLGKTVGELISEAIHAYLAASVDWGPPHSPLFFGGHRGIKLDPGALADAIVAGSKLAVDLGNVFSQLDINPIAFADQAPVALDAKMVVRTRALPR